MRRLGTPIAIVTLVYLSYFLVAAALAQLQFISQVERSNSLLSIFLFGLSLVLFFAVPFVVASGIAPACVLYICRVHSIGAYFASGILSALFAAYVFIFNFAVADNVGDLLVHVPSKDSLVGFIYEEPPFADTVAMAFRDVAFIWHDGWVPFAGVSIVTLAIGVICSGLFWSIGVCQMSSS